MRVRIMCALGLFLAIQCGGAVAKVIYVNRNITPASADGLSWATALKTITLGLNAAAPGDEVWVAAGTYTESVGLKPNVGLYGGFIGLETARSQRFGIPGLTTLDGMGRISLVYTPTTDIVGPKTVLDGFTIRNGIASSTRQGGAAIAIRLGGPTITHNIIVGNVASASQSEGGAIYCATGTRPLIANNIITANSADYGGGIYVDHASPTVVNNTITGNAGIVGGGLYIDGPSSGIYANNIIAFNRTGVCIADAGTIFRSNCLYGNELGDLLGDQSYLDPSRTLQADPKLAAYAFGNMHLQPDSPCRDAGDDGVMAAGGCDIDLQPRTMGAHVDIGADESDGRIWTHERLVFHVRQDANDSNDGLSWATAKRTIPAALSAAAQQGGEVWVAAGTYPVPWVPNQPYEPMPYTLPAFVYLYGGFAGTETALAQRNASATPTVLSTGKYAAVVSQVGQHQSAVDGFLIINGANTAYPPGAASGVVCSGGSPTIMNNVLAANAGAVSLYNSSAVIANNTIVGNSPACSNGAAVSCTSSTPTISGNLFADNGPSGAVSAPGAISLSSCPKATIANNVFRANRMYAAGNASVLQVRKSTALVANNTMAYNIGYAMCLDTESRATIANNIIAFSYGPLAGSVSPVNVTCRANCLYGLTYPYMPSPFTTAQGNFMAYPAFADLGEDDLRLAASSPCVDTGDDTVVWPGEVDLDGLPRIQGRGVDIGAYESSFTGVVRNWPNVARILRVAGGLANAESAEADQLNGDGQAGLSVADAIILARWLIKNPIK